jgi:Ras-related protein Rab-18
MQEMTSMEEILKIKIIIVGPVSVGKSSIVRGFAKGQFANQVRGNGEESNTIAVDFMKKVLKVDNKTVRVDLYDTAGT